MTQNIATLHSLFQNRNQKFFFSLIKNKKMHQTLGIIDFAVAVWCFRYFELLSLVDDKREIYHSLFTWRFELVWFGFQLFLSLFSFSYMCSFAFNQTQTNPISWNCCFRFICNIKWKSSVENTTNIAPSIIFTRMLFAYLFSLFSYVFLLFLLR